ncbi:reverse transcriptase domain-containing protein [Tanacetum coccineum]
MYLTPPSIFFSFLFLLDGVNGQNMARTRNPEILILYMDDLVSKFINFFFPPSKTTNLRNEITNFQQIAQESFSEAWERFKELLRKVIHHHGGIMELGNVNQTNQVNHGANLGLNQQAQAYQAPVAQVPVTYSRFEAYTKANDATLTNLQKNLNDFKREQNEFQNEQRNFQNMMLNMFQKQMGNNNASGSGTLPSNTIPNPRNEVKAITTRSGLAYDGPLPPMPPPYVNPDKEDGKETEVTKDQVQPTSSQSTARIQPPVIQKSHDPVKPVSSPISPEPSSAQVNNSPPSKEPSKKTHLPYPQRMKAQKQKEKNDMQLHNILKWMKRSSFLKEKLLEAANTPLTENCSAVIMKKLPEKLGDPGCFLIPSLSYLSCHNQDALARFRPNGSLAIPTGIAEDVLIRGLIDVPRGEIVIRGCFKTFSNPLFEKKDGFPSRNDESILKEELSRQISLKVNSEPSIESLPKDDFDNDDDLFEMDSKNVEWKRILYGEDFERMDSDSDKTKDFDKSSSSVLSALVMN